ncbi:cytochrome-c peroxidase [Flavihumibacter profundi]|uniref:cytochrome-c peroxidase n=1 Tax=Flavihumibacter profundi TaxID=2716883 RepID=UPI001CC403DD|nr:cytochrome c peroxidase [Flavihumibacter profundi]MBZ5857979.1 c-type cytochrome [Flavihumibacter profundi]
MNRFRIPKIIAVLVVLVVIAAACAKDKNELTVVPVDKVQLGRLIFFDTTLSNPVGQSCASCHSPAVAFSDPLHRISPEGAISGRFTNRNSPSIAYTQFAPAFHFEPADSVYVGGFFLDGRVNSLEEQAVKPFLNPLEMNNANAAMLVAKLQAAAYYPFFKKVYGEARDAGQAFGQVTDALAQFERSRELNPFSSKYDAYLNGKAVLTEQEARGLVLFNDPGKGNCAACHPSAADEDLGKALFTDYTYDNIGVPKNPGNPFYTVAKEFNPRGAAALDRGLGGFLGDAAFNGQFKVPGLRNVALTAPYFHNGFFNTLEEVVHFYNRRDVEAFPAPEFPASVNRAEMGNLGLSDKEEADIVAFLKTLSDGYQ